MITLPSMDFGDFDVDAYLQLPLNTPNVPTSPVTPMVPISPTAAVLHPASNSVDILYDDFCQGDDLNQGYLYQDDDLGNLYQDDDLYQGNLYQGEFYQEDLYQGDLYQDDSLYHQDDDLQIDYYGETAPEMSELDWLPQNAIELTGLNHPSIDAIDAFVQANLNDPTPDDVAEQYLNSTDLEYGHQDRLTNEANDPHMSDHIPSLPDGTSQEDSLETKEDNSSENHAAIKDLRSLVLKEFKIIRAERAAFEDKMVTAIIKLNAFAEETPALIEMFSDGLDRATQSREQDE